MADMTKEEYEAELFRLADVFAGGLERICRVMVERGHELEAATKHLPKAEVALAINRMFARIEEGTTFLKDMEGAFRTDEKEG